MANESSLLLVPSNMKADVWNHFGFRKLGNGTVDKSKVVCRICKAEVKYSGNTTNLRNHLTRHHPDVQLMLTSETDTRQQSIETAFKNKMPHNSPRAQNITESIALFICKDLRPYSVVENEGFSNMVEVLEPCYTIPGRKQMSESVIPRLYETLKESVTLSLQSADRVALTCDAWTSLTQDSFVTITSHFIGKQWDNISYVLQTRAMYASHTGANIAELLSEALNEWNLTNKDPVIITDNAANMVRAIEILEVPHIGCFAHILNLASQSALKLPAISRLLGRVRRIVTFFHRSTKASHVLKEKQALLNLPRHKLKTDVITRWNSALDMLERFLEQQPAISATLLSPEVRRSEKDLCTLTEADITVAEDIVKALRPMKSATLVMSDEAHPTLSVIAPLHSQLLEEMRHCSGDSNIVKYVKYAVHHDLNFRYTNLKEMLYVASAIDPHFKTLPFASVEDREDTFMRLITETVSLDQAQDHESDCSGTRGGAPTQEQSSNDGPSPPKTSKGSCALLDLLGAAYAPVSPRVNSTVADRAKEEVAKYREVAPLPLSENPLKWWSMHEGEYPLLSRQAKRYLCVPGTSVPAERIFSTAGDILTAKRNCLLPEHVDQLLFLHKNYKM
ncbi:hypothetical protein ACEWY4_025510 [Coilia grayii]|uniref:BED-type domain-containing protein n=1 Tax=Coilia grayii TaxID=363190 RepID=A0ABD1IXX6_9TELE